MACYSFREMKEFLLSLGKGSNKAAGFEAKTVGNIDVLKTPIRSQWANHVFLWEGACAQEEYDAVSSFMKGHPYLIRLWSQSDDPQVHRSFIEREGFEQISEGECLTRDLPQEGSLRPPINQNIDVKPVCSEADFTEWNRIFNLGFQWRNPEMIEFSRALRNNSAQNGSSQLLLAYLDGKPVGQSIVYYGAEAAGNHFASVLPEFRGCGVATSMILKRLEMAYAKGYQCQVVQGVPSIVALYKKLGYRTTGAFKNFARQKEK